MDDLYSYLEQKKKEEEQGISDATSNLQTQQLIGNLGQAINQYVSAPSNAKSGRQFDPSFYQNLNRQAEQQASMDIQQRRKTLEDAIQARKMQADAEKAKIEQDRSSTLFQQGQEERSKQANKESAEADPESQESKLAQGLAKEMLPSRDFSGMSAAQLKQSLPMINKLYEAKQSSMDRQANLQARQEEQNIRREEMADARAQRQANIEQARQDKLEMLKQKAIPEGIKELDKSFAKDYSEWNSTSKAAVDKNLERLKQAKQKLEESKSDIVGYSGRLVGQLPDVLRSETSKTIRDDVRAAAQGALKATLGAQFTEKEGERIMKSAYDESLSPEANIAKIDAAIKELEAGKKAKDDMTKYFEENKTLSGYKASPAVAQFPKTVMKDGKQATVSNQQELDEALSEGWK